MQTEFCFTIFKIKYKLTKTQLIITVRRVQRILSHNVFKVEKKMKNRLF